MLYLNQLEHPDIEYKTRVGLPEPHPETTVATSGCGLCCACMIVENLTVRKLSLEEARQISYDVNANYGSGTAMVPFAKRFAELYGLDYHATDDTAELAEHLHRGGMAIIHVNGDFCDRIGLFSKTGHYITAISIDRDELCILDPSYREGKYDLPGRREKVRVDYPFIYAPLSCLPEEAKRSEKAKKYMHLFKRRSPEK